MHAGKQRCHAMVHHCYADAIPREMDGLSSSDSQRSCRMLGASPSFPPGEVWQKMSESEQDALI